MIKSWIFEFSTAERSDAPIRPAYEWFLDIWERAETLGFEGIFLSEHHLPMSLTPSPNILLAALAMRTTRLRMGVMALTAPMYHPARLAEEIAMLDQLSGGRLEIGLARGSSTAEVEGIGVPPEEMKPRLEEALDIVEGALTATEPFNYEGRYYQCRDLVVNPRTLQQPLPPRWITVMTPESAAAAARRGYKICAGFLSSEKIAGIFDAYRAAAEAAGRPLNPDDLAIRRLVVVDEDGDTARAFGKIAFSSPGGDPEQLAPWMSQEEIISGTADDVTEEILRQFTCTGAGHILIYGGFPLTRPKFERTVELYGRDVLPRLMGSVSPTVGTIAA